jgi:hypothetical protein
MGSYKRIEDTPCMVCKKRAKKECSIWRAGSIVVLQTLSTTSACRDFEFDEVI